MTIAIECPKCRKSYRVQENLVGRRVRCKACGETISVSAEPAPIDTMRPADHAAGKSQPVEATNRGGSAKWWLIGGAAAAVLLVMVIGVSWIVLAATARSRPGIGAEPTGPVTEETNGGSQPRAALTTPAAPVAKVSVAEHRQAWLAYAKVKVAADAKGAEAQESSDRFRATREQATLDITMKLRDEYGKLLHSSTAALNELARLQNLDQEGQAAARKAVLADPSVAAAYRKAIDEVGK